MVSIATGTKEWEVVERHAIAITDNEHNVTTCEIFNMGTYMYPAQTAINIPAWLHSNLRTLGLPLNLGNPKTSSLDIIIIIIITTQLLKCQSYMSYRYLLWVTRDYPKHVTLDSYCSRSLGSTSASSISCICHNHAIVYF